MTRKTTRRRTNRRYRQNPRHPPLRLSPYAWAKLLALRDLGETEVGGFGVSQPGDLLLVEDVRLVRQECTLMTVKFDDESVADYFDQQVDEGRKPEEFARIWIHTHPGDSPHPSCTDEATFERCFGNSDWAIMFIVARGGQTYARLRFGTGPGGELILPVEIDFQTAFAASDPDAWEAEYRQLVRPETERPRSQPVNQSNDAFLAAWLDDERLRYRDAWFDSFPPDLYPDMPLEPIDALF
jgi:hypothetical protein